ncbi:MAG: AAA family ATPase [Myxococcota bacterium]
MDDATLESLVAALAATPDNKALINVVAQALLDRDEPQRALDVCRSDAPEVRMLRAQALLVLGRHEEARKEYATAVAANPTLEDRDFAKVLDATVKEVSREGAPPLRVIANDDTDDSELLRLIQPESETVTFADVGGLEDVKKQIERRIILPFKKPSLFRKFKKRSGGGILLYGPPGCGKTLLARATAGECDASFFSVAISDILDTWIGESERKLHAIFEKARSSEPAVLFFDELEALAGKRKFTREGTSSKLVSQFLAEMDGFTQNNQGVLILGATNVPWAVDGAFRRPGRFDRLHFVPPPDRAARLHILDLQLEGRPVAAKLKAEDFAKQTGGFSGADLSHLVETASDLALEASLDAGIEVPIDRTHLQEALAEVKPTTAEWLTTARNYARYADEGGFYDEVLQFLEKHGKRR